MRDARFLQVWVTAAVALLAGGVASYAAGGIEYVSLTTTSTPRFAGLGLGVAGPATGLQVQGGVASVGTLTTTSNNPALNLDQTWNNAGVSSFNLVSGNVTATAGKGNLLNLALGGTSVFSVSSDGALTCSGGQTSDTAAPASLILGSTAYSQAQANTSGGPVRVCGGIGAQLYSFIFASNCVGSTFTVTINGTAHVLTDGTSFTHSNTESVEAANLAGAIAGLSGVTATAVTTNVYVAPSSGTYQLSIASNANPGTGCGVSGTTQLVTVTGLNMIGPNGITMQDAENLAFGGSTGTQIGTSTTQKIGFYGATPVVQTTGSTDVLAGLVTSGLRAASSNPPLNLGSGAITGGAATLGATTVTTLGTAGNVTLTDGNNFVIGTSNGTKFGTGTSQKIGFFNATPVVQEAGSNDVLASLVTLGLRAASSNPPLNLGSGTLTVGSAVVPTVGTTSATTVNLQYNSGTSLSLIGKPATSAATTTVQATGVNGGSVAYGVLHTSTTLSTGAASTNLGVNVPAGSVVYATSCRVTTAITTAVTFNLEDSLGKFYGGTIAAALNTTGVYGGPPATTTGGTTLAPNFYAAANTFKIVCNATPGAGVVETIIYYYTITAPTS